MKALDIFEGEVNIHEYIPIMTLLSLLGLFTFTCECDSRWRPDHCWDRCLSLCWRSNSTDLRRMDPNRIYLYWQRRKMVGRQNYVLSSWFSSFELIKKDIHRSNFYNYSPRFVDIVVKKKNILNSNEFKTNNDGCKRNKFMRCFLAALFNSKNNQKVFENNKRKMMYNFIIVKWFLKCKLE